MLSEQLVAIVGAAASYASKIGSQSTDLFHLLLAMVDESEIQRLLRGRGVDYGDLREALITALDARQPSPPRAGPMTLSPLVTMVLERAFLIDRSCSLDRVLEVVWGLDHDSQEDFAAAQVLKSFAASSTRSIPDEGAVDKGREPPSAGVTVTAQAVRTVPETVSKHCVDLVASARAGDLDPVYGREAEIARLEEILSRRRKNNPILIGEPGVGKTAVVEALASRIAAGKAPRSLSGVRIMSLDVMSLISGTRNRGDFEERLGGLVEAFAADPALVLFVDEIHTLVGAASGAADAANLLKPALQSGRLRCIGATTHGEFARYFDADPAMARRFQPVRVEEPSREAAVGIMKRLLPAYATHHSVAYLNEAAEAAVDLSVRFILGRQLPDKAMDVLDEAGALAASRGYPSVGVAEVREVISRMSGVRIGGAPVSLDLVGQEEATTMISRAISRSSTGLSRPGRARLSMLLVGPEGSGKAYAAERLASLAGVRLKRFDMSAFREPHSVSRLVGAPPGYVGYGSGGQLTEAARREPSCVLLVERIDLAHPEVVEVFAQAAAKGVLTDAAGRETSFAGVTMVFTSLPQGSEGGGSIGFAPRQPRDSGTPDSISSLARAVDCVVPFEELGTAALAELASAKVREMIDGLRRSGVGVEVAGDLAAMVAEAAACEGGGGRGIEQAFRRMIEEPVLDAVPGAAALQINASHGSVTVSTAGRRA